MADDGPQPITRRRFLQGSALLPVVVVFGACGDDASETANTARPRDTTATAPAEPSELPPTPSCDDGDDATPEQTEGPYFKPDSPRRANLVTEGVTGERLTFTGTVVDTSCRPVRAALLDFWQADADGEYDNVGHRLRGHQFTDARGRFRLDTIVPALYPGRTRHIHVKVQRPGGEVLTTQLYFPGEPSNAEDRIFDDALVMSVRRTAGGRRARFTFVLA